MKYKIDDVEVEILPNNKAHFTLNGKVFEKKGSENGDQKRIIQIILTSARGTIMRERGIDFFEIKKEDMLKLNERFKPIKIK